VSVATRVWLVNSLVAMGDFEAPVARAGAATRRAERTDHPSAGAPAHGPRGVAGGRRPAPHLNISAGMPMLSCQLGLVCARQGRVAEGLALLEDGVQRAVALSIRRRHARRLGWLS